MKTIILHSKPWLDSQDIRSVVDVLKSGQFTQGVKVSEFEEKFTQFQKCKGSVAINSGTAALHLSLLALGIKKGDEVIIPSYVCTALLNAVNYTEATPKIVDVNADDFNISFESVKKNLTKKTKAIIVPHMFGQAADIKPLLCLGIPVIEDCAQSVGATYEGKNVGTFGTLSIFSFYATKVMCSGEGGMVSSSNKRLLDKIRDLRNYDNRKSYKVRYNYKMTDMAAALGINQLNKLLKIIAQRRKIAKFYNAQLADMSIDLPVENIGNKHIYFRYVVKTKSKAKFIKYLQKNGIACAEPVYKPLHQYTKIISCPVADRLMKEAVSIPIYPFLKVDQIKYIVKLIALIEF
ncbi:Aminotransferase, DegT/DnrJ/EryC1/StrS family [hydrothermal vent metagenome]|uniref:Aminotransferase, DegT/DnrJ/EryC1/StrS family n=1 Tax=hydrothermal vent metagenome TaxID=652676 RepID=A0A3B1DQ39_9ZZZZ